MTENLTPTSDQPMKYVRIGPGPLDDRARHEMVRMRDGVRLATDVYLAGDRDNPEPGPTILVRLPYDKVGSYTFIPSVAAYFADRGYHVVAQDVRGKFRSEGEPLLFVNEASDGYDTLDWVVEQSWSDGIVGMWGDSYYGYTQWAAASTSHPALRAISPRVTGTRLGDLPVDVPGAITREVEMGVHRLYACMFFHDHDVYDWVPDWTRRPLAAEVERFFATVGTRSRSWDQWFPEPVRLERFPFGHPYDARPIPVLQTIGWWDNCAPWQWADHWALQDRQGWSHNEFLVIDSIDHECFHLLDEPLPPGAERDRESELPAMLDPTVEFFDVFLRNLKPASELPRVRWNLAHTKGFRVAESWPPSGVQPLVLCLGGDGTLAEGGDEATSDMHWVHDPDDLVPSPVKNAFGFLMEYPDEQAWADRHDVLVFDGEPVGRDTDLVGGVRLEATVGSDGARMDLFVRLLDVAPEGPARLVARGQVHVQDSSEPRRVQVDLQQIGYRLAAGHHLRVHLASSDYPEFVPQPGTGEHPWLATESRANRQSVLLGGPEGARLTLHVLPPG